MKSGLALLAASSLLVLMAVQTHALATGDRVKNAAGSEGAAFHLTALVTAPSWYTWTGSTSPKGFKSFRRYSLLDDGSGSNVDLNRGLINSMIWTCSTSRQRPSYLDIVVPNEVPLAQLVQDGSQTITIIFEGGADDGRQAQLNADVQGNEIFVDYTGENKSTIDQLLATETYFAIPFDQGYMLTFGVSDNVFSSEKGHGLSEFIKGALSSEYQGVRLQPIIEPRQGCN